MTPSGLIAGETSIAAEKGVPDAALSLLSSIPPESARPRLERPTTSPADTHLPCASITVAPEGAASPAPAATTWPSVKITVPLGIGAVPSPIATVPPTIAVVAEKAGAAISAAAASRSAFISRLPNPAGPVRSR